MERKIRTLFIFFISSLFFILLILVLRPANIDDYSEIFFLNVGQADSILIQSQNGKRILIDTGRDSKVLNELSKIIPIGDRKIDVILITHNDLDHMGGLKYVLKRYDVGLFLTTESLGNSKNLEESYNILYKKSIPSFYVRSGMRVVLQNNDLISSTLDILFPDRDTFGWKTNSSSIVAKMNFGERSVLLTGDTIVSVEEYLSKSIISDILSADILKVAHHGSKTSTGEKFLSKVKPVLAIVSSGIGNIYGHPHQDVVDRLTKNKIDILNTQNGRIHLRTDGNKWKK